jgi:mRNA-degrading endonuclease toxin of MazEF toxin-antitoxin module
MALRPEEIRRGAIVLVRLPEDKARPAVIVRADLLAGLPYATILPLTTEWRSDVDFRIAVEPTEENGLRENVAGLSIGVELCPSIWSGPLGADMGGLNI